MPPSIKNSVKYLVFPRSSSKCSPPLLTAGLRSLSSKTCLKDWSSGCECVQDLMPGATSKQMGRLPAVAQPSAEPRHPRLLLVAIHQLTEWVSISFETNDKCSGALLSSCQLQFRAALDRKQALPPPAELFVRWGALWGAAKSNLVHLNST